MLKIQGVSHALRRGAPNESGVFVASKLADRLDGALRQMGRLTDLVERLLDVSVLVQGQLPMSPEHVSLADVVQETVEDFREAALARGSELHFVTAGDVLGFWDRARVEQVVVNLLSNAIKYGGGNPIDISLTGTETGVRLVVRDRGIGIADADIERIFVRFERAAPVRHYGGLGLGLYITRSIVTALGGTIHVSSKLDEGTTFVIQLPRHPQSSEPGQ